METGYMSPFGSATSLLIYFTSVLASVPIGTEVSRKTYL